MFNRDRWIEIFETIISTMLSGSFIILILLIFKTLDYLYDDVRI